MVTASYGSWYYLVSVFLFISVSFLVLGALRPGEKKRGNSGQDLLISQRILTGTKDSFSLRERASTPRPTAALEVPRAEQPRDVGGEVAVPLQARAELSTLRGREHPAGPHVAKQAPRSGSEDGDGPRARPQQRRPGRARRKPPCPHGLVHRGVPRKEVDAPPPAAAVDPHHRHIGVDLRGCRRSHGVVRVSSMERVFFWRPK